MENKIVEIVYYDITQIENKKIDEVEDAIPKILKAVGYLVDEEDFTKIIYNFDSSGENIQHDALVIPNGCIISMRNLK